MPMSTNDIKMSKIESVGLHFAKKSDDLTWNDPIEMVMQVKHLTFFICIKKVK